MSTPFTEMTKGYIDTMLSFQMFLISWATFSYFFSACIIVVIVIIIILTVLKSSMK